MKKQNALRLVDTRTLDRGLWLEVRAVASAAPMRPRPLV